MTPDPTVAPAPPARPDAVDRLASDVLAGLSARPRTLPSMFFYDEAGGALYDKILALPEYYPPRMEAAILARHAGDILDLAGPGDLVELGAGSATRTRLLLAEVARRGWPLAFAPTDASAAMLGSTVEALRAEFPGGRFEGILGDYGTTLASLAARSGRMVVFLGGTVGNLDDGEIRDLAARVAGALGPAGTFLVGYDRRPSAAKPRETIELAYDDPAGVTARFNRNLLARLNRELGADFDLTAWRHRAPYDPALGRIELHLVSERDQRVRIAALEQTFAFAAGEFIRTEISRRFEAGALAPLLAPLRLAGRWSDERGFFELALFRKVGDT